VNNPLIVPAFLACLLLIMAAFLLGFHDGLAVGLQEAGEAGTVPVQCLGQKGWHLSCD
jgi:hypothetical protein